MSELTPDQNKELSDLSSRIEKWVDKGLRHKSGVKPNDYLKHFLSISREYGFATHDNSWGEFEKEFMIIVKRMVIAERILSMFGIDRQP